MNIRNNINFIFNKKVVRVCFDLYQINIFFEESIYIEIGESVRYIKKNGDSQIWNYKTNKEISLNALIGKSTLHATVDCMDNLIIEFFDGDKIEIEAAHERSESYIVHNNNDFQVIS